MLKRFVLWVITKYLNGSDIVDALIDRWPAKDQTTFYIRGLYLKYRDSTNEERVTILRALNENSYYDTPVAYVHYELLMARVLNHQYPFGTANSFIDHMVSDAFIGAHLKSNYVKYNAYLTNVVRKTLGDISTVDTHLIVALLKKRVEE